MYNGYTLADLQNYISNLAKPDPINIDCSEVALYMKNLLPCGKILTIMSPRNNVSINTFITETYGQPSINFLGDPYDFHSVLCVNLEGVDYVIDMFSNAPVLPLNVYMSNLKRYNNGLDFVVFEGEYEESYIIRLLEKLDRKRIRWVRY